MNLNFSQIIAFIINLYLSTRNVMTFDSIHKIFVVLIMIQRPNISVA